MATFGTTLKLVKIRRSALALRVHCLTVAGALLTTTPPPIQAADRFDWMPAEAIGGRLLAEDLGGEQIIPEITLTKTPKPTAEDGRGKPDCFSSGNLSDQRGEPSAHRPQRHRD